MSASAWDRAVAVGAKAICDGTWETADSDTARRMADDCAELALAAALPVLLDELAQRIEAEERPPYAIQRFVRYADVRIVRGFAAEVTQ